jgi:ABC-type Mn2+/Zn2+ transport system ATPase subunit
MNDLGLAYRRHSHLDPVPGVMALAVKDLCVGYAGARTLALDRISLQVPCGVCLALVGSNGAGKSTLLKAIAGLVPRSSGDIWLYGRPPGTCHHRLAYLPQQHQLDWRFPISVRRLVLTGRYVHLGWLRRPGRRDVALMWEALERLGLIALAERQIGQLSGGQQQRVLLARALVQEADLLLLDEPLNAVDADTCEIIGDVLRVLQRRGKTVIVATHDVSRLTTDFDDVLYLREGRAALSPPGCCMGVPIGRTN